jgi:hypothetical protein
MKPQTLLLAGAIGLAASHAANAQNRVYITGSTAYRNAINQTIFSLFDSAPQVAAFGNATYYKANTLDFEGTISGVSYIIKCSWSGSEAGIKDVATGQQENFVDDIGTGTPTVTAVASATGAVAGQLSAHTVDLALGDNAQTYSKTRTPALNNNTFIGIIPFVWVKNAQVAGSQTGTDWARITNLTDSQARVLLSGGSVAALLTGNPADVNHIVYVSGRDDGSGTRVNTFGETGFGIRTIPTQILIGGSAGAPTIANSGNVGQASGGTLANSLGFAGSLQAADTVNGGTGWIALGYLGKSDADTAEAANGGGANGAQELTFNGVPESAAAIQQGQYSFWGNEYVFQAPGASPAAVTVYNGIVNNVNTHTDGIHEISTASMQTTRLGPLSDPGHN